MYLVAHHYRSAVITSNLKLNTEWRDEVLVYRLNLRNGKVTLEGGSSVPRRGLYQYSMDEYN